MARGCAVPDPRDRGRRVREPAAEAEYVATIPGCELFVYPRSGQLFAEQAHPHDDEAAARVATERVLTLLAAR